ncbi:MAG: serpin family protein [Gammaproteobacteria bacterium]|nr:serpin family protein [Gammaproteobacteria bacterium]
MRRFLSLSLLLAFAMTASAKDFSVNFFQKIAHHKSTENFVLSGTSLEAVLLMLQEGALGDTQRELSMALCGSSKACQNVVSKQKDYDVANAIWVQQGLVIKPNYLDTIKKRYQGEILSADFQKNALKAVEQVNQWANTNTHGMIKDILQPSDVDKSTAMILANAIYFQGFWPVEFDVKNTANMDFTLLNNKKVSVATMTKKDDYFIANQNGIQLVGLPYRDSQLEMLVLMPEETKKFPDFIRALSNEKIQSLLGAQQKSEFTLFLPKFSISSSYTDLKATLQSLGIRTIFTTRADLSNINDQVSLSLDKVLQKAVIIVDEKGTKAAAVTAGIVMTRAVMPRMVHIDRPFVFAIVDRNSRDILFMGQVVNPGK